MMPWFPIAVVSALLAITVFAYECDQENKREEEQKRARDKIADLKNRISRLELEHDHLLPVLGMRNDQVRAMANEISSLRAELEKARRRAG